MIFDLVNTRHSYFFALYKSNNEENSSEDGFYAQCSVMYAIPIYVRTFVRCICSQKPTYSFIIRTMKEEGKNQTCTTKSPSQFSSHLLSFLFSPDNIFIFPLFFLFSYRTYISVIKFQIGSIRKI